MRIPYLKYDELTDDQRKLWDDMAGGKRTAGRDSGFLTNDEGGLVGPFNAWLQSPGIGQRVQSLGASLRFESSLPNALLEIAILVTAQHWRAEFEWWAHARFARRAGIPDAIIEAIRKNEEPPFEDPSQHLVFDFCRALIATRRVDDELYARTKELLGEPGLVELTSLLGYYGLVSMTLNVFDVPLPAGTEPAFPD